MTQVAIYLMVLLSQLLLPQDPPQKVEPGKGIEDPKARKTQPDVDEADKVGELELKTPTSWPNPGQLRWLTSIDQYRQESDGNPYVARLEDVRDLDLSNVDYDAAVLATINGQEVTRNEFQLWYGLTGGQTGVSRAQIEILVNNGIARLVKDGADPSDFEVSDEDVAARLKEEEDLARSQGEAALSSYIATVQQGIGWDRYKDYVRSNMKAEHFVLPRIIKGAPAEEQSGLPVEAAILLEDQKDVRDWLMKSYESGEPMAPIFRTYFLRMLLDKMIAQAEIHLGLNEPLPEGVFMTIDGTSVMIDDILAYASGQQKHKEAALRLCLLYKVLDQHLEANSALLDDATFAAEFDKHNAEFEGTLFPLRNVIAMHGFMSMDEYKQYYRRRAAFQIYSDKDGQLDATLQKHQNSVGKLFYENGKLLLDVFWVSVADVKAKDGSLSEAAAWDQARSRLTAAKAALDAGKSADDVRKEFCSDDFSFGRDGKDKPRGRNEMRQLFGETQYGILSSGYSLADDLFYNRKELELVGPLKIDSEAVPGLGLAAVKGFAMVRVLDFGISSTVKPFKVQRPLIFTDYFDLKLSHFTWELLGKAELKLTTRS